jgi:hypothetical protein
VLGLKRLLKVLGLLLMVSVTMLPPALVALIYRRRRRHALHLRLRVILGTGL